MVNGCVDGIFYNLSLEDRQLRCGQVHGKHLKLSETNFCRFLLFHFSFMCHPCFSIPISYVYLFFVCCLLFFPVFLPWKFWNPCSSFLSHQEMLCFLHIFVSVSEPNTAVKTEKYLWHLVNVLLQHRQVVSSFKMQRTLLSEHSKFVNNRILPPFRKCGSKKVSISLMASVFSSSTSQ